MTTLDDGLHVRAAALDDAAATAALINACDAADYGREITSTESLLAEWTQADRDLARDAWLVVDAGGQVAGYAEISARRAVRFLSDVFVHPAYRGRGIGSTLLRLVEARARAQIDQAPPDARVVLNAVAPTGQAAADALLTREGFAISRYWWRMEVALDGPPPAPVWPAGLAARPFDAGQDKRAAFEALEAAFKDHWGYVPSTFEDWQRRHMGRPDFDPSLWFVAEPAGQPGAPLAGVVQGYWEPPDGFVQGIGVRPEWRRRGLGLALLRQAIAAFYARGIHRVALTVDAANPTGATGLYEKAGMHVVHQYTVYVKELRPGRALA